MMNHSVGLVFGLTVGLMFLPSVTAQVRGEPKERQSQTGASTRDLSGVWMLQEPTASFSKEQPPPMTPWGVDRFKSNRPTMGADQNLNANDPTLDCLPPGVPYALIVPTPVEIVQTADRVFQLFEFNHSIRRIYTDGRQHPKDLIDNGIFEWMGHSIGWWEGETFVIDTIGFNDKTWLDRLGRPHSDALHVVEHLQRLDHDTMEYDVLIDDPQAYTNSWKGQLIFKLKSDWDVLEHVCTSGGEEYLQYKTRAWAPTK